MTNEAYLTEEEYQALRMANMYCKLGALKFHRVKEDVNVIERVDGSQIEAYRTVVQVSKRRDVERLNEVLAPYMDSIKACETFNISEGNLR